MYGCPNCGAELEYNIKTGKLSCDSCGGKYSVEAVNKQNDGEKDLYDINIFRCPQCGGEVYSTNTTIAGFCSYCGASTVLTQRTAQVNAPSSILPFKIEKSECVKAFNEYAKKGRYVPKEYKEIEGTKEFRGIYVPYHNYTAEVEGVYHTTGRTETVTKKKGNKRWITGKEWDININVSGSISNITHDGSEAFRDDQSELINESSDRGQSVPFSPAYLCGFYGDLSDVDAKDCEEYARSVADKHIKESISDKIGSMDVKKPDKEPNVTIQHKGDVLKPVWFMSYRNKDRVAYAVVNGRSGKMSCDLPVDTKKFFLVSGIISAVIFLVMLIFDGVMFTTKTMVGIAAFFNLLAWIFYSSNIKKMYDRDIKREYKLQRHKGKMFFMPHHQAITGVLAILIVPVFFLIAFILISGSIFITVELNSRVLMCIVAAVVQAVSLIRNYKKYIALVKNGKKPSAAIILSVVCTLMLLAVSYINPVDDIWYYAAVLISFLIIVAELAEIILDYNKCCTRPLPQFELYKGGHNNEKSI